ncbi:MAG: NADPH:quinone oxidoreductase family protein [Ectothiorhodospiraceae bacterium]|nr:NADPH:quinone oxidoreductase family protein [Ectothiorhodospiraceae bacterium]
MKALICESWRPFDELELKTVPEPALDGPGDVRIRILHSGVSFATTLVVQGKYQRKPPLPFAPGTEIAGEVLEVGAEVRHLAVGDRVCAVLDWGGYAEQVVVHARHVLPVPESLPLEASVALPISYMTAYGALVWRAKVRPGERGLIHGAAGGGGLAAVEIALALGCEVYAVVRGERKAAFLRERSAQHVIDSSAQPFRDAVESLTRGEGVHVVRDTIGGSVFRESLRCLQLDGRHIVIGFAQGEIPQVPANILLLKNISVSGFNVGQYIGWGVVDERERYAGTYRRGMEQLINWWADGRIAPKVHARLPLGQFREAMAKVTGREAIGRVVLDI